MRKTVFLVRHGQASAGTHDYDRLSDLGKTQARIIGQHWQNRATRPGYVRTGTLRRQRETAILARCLPETHGPEFVHAGLDEYDHRDIHPLFHPDTGHAAQPARDAQGREEDVPVSIPFETYARLLENWMRAEPQANASSAPGFEPWSQFKARTLNTVKEAALHSTEDEIVLYTSGGVISVITAQIEQLNDDQIAHRIWDLNNASISTLGFVDGKFEVLGLNDVTHLEAERQPELLTKI